MRLPWREKALPIGDRTGPPISTSITDRELVRLGELAAGRIVVEIGSAYGYTAIAMARPRNGDRGAAHVLSVDPHDGFGSLPDSFWRMRANVQAYGVAHVVSMLRIRSDDVWPMLAALDVSPELVFVDGDHRYDAVVSDIDCAWSLLTHGGTLAVHDYGEATCEDVMPAVEGFCRRLRARGVTPDTELVDTLFTAVKP